MKVVCYLPYDDYNNDSFEVSSDYYGNDGYANALNDAFNGMNKAINGDTYAFDMNGIKVSKNEEKVVYSSCEAMLYNGDGNEEDVEHLINHISLNEPYICIFSFDYSKMDEEFEYELKTWLMSFNKINNLNADDNFKFSRQVRKTMKVKFVDEIGFESCVDFIDCRIVSDEVGVVMIVDKLIFNKCVE